jgi:hypothetical protein
LRFAQYDVHEREQFIDGHPPVAAAVADTNVRWRRGIGFVGADRAACGATARTVRLRQRVTKGAGSRTKGLLMAYKLLDMAQARWRRLNGAHLLALVRAGIGFRDGVQQEGTVNRTKAKAA